MKTKIVLFVTVALTLILCLAACGGAGEGKEVKVMVSLGEGAAVIGDNPVSVKVGQSASFQMKLEEDYLVESCEGAVYDEKTGILTVSAVTKKTNINFVTRLRENYTVSLNLGENVYVSGQSTLSVKEGRDCTFNLSFTEGYSPYYISAGSYDFETGILTLENVKSNLTVEIEALPSDLDTSVSYVYRFNGAGKDTTTIPSSSAVYSGMPITVKAGDMTKAFLGWKVAGKIVSTSRTYSFKLSADTVIAPTYLDIDTLIYDANGGNVNTSSANISSRNYYTATANGSLLSVKLSSEYLDYMESASTFYDDGSFTREGYVLVEYNTKADGSGEGYSLGSKFPMLPINEDQPKLYCIWAKSSAENLFEYTDITIDLPQGVTAAKAPNWITGGVKITSYKGNEGTVVIPEKLGGKYVIAIGAGAFTNKSLDTLAMGRHIIVVEDGAFSGCSSLSKMYFPDGLYVMNNEALDNASRRNLATIYVNATTPPRYSYVEGGRFAMKLSRMLYGKYDKQIVVIAGSSSYQGLGSEYLEALLEGEYRVVNFGTTRTTHGTMYLEAMGALLGEDDTVIYAPENSSYMFGERELYWKTLRDLEGMNNIYRYVDMRNYDNFFGAFTAFNRDRYQLGIQVYESILNCRSYISKYGDNISGGREALSSNYYDVYYITMNERIKSKNEGEWENKEFQEQNKDYTDLNNPTWCSFTDADFSALVNHSIARAKSGGCKVYFGFCPIDASKLVDGANNKARFDAYDELILETFDFDGNLGSSVNYAFAHTYFYDNAFHLNDYGRTYRTYQMYLDLCALFGITEVNGFTERGTGFAGCRFESGSSGNPLTDSGVN